MNNKWNKSKAPFIKELKSREFIAFRLEKQEGNELWYTVKIGELLEDEKEMTLKDLSNKINEVLVGMKSMQHSIDEINVRLDRLEKDVSVLKSDVSVLKSEAKKHGWNV